MLALNNEWHSYEVALAKAPFACVGMTRKLLMSSYCCSKNSTQKKEKMLGKPGKEFFFLLLSGLVFKRFSTPKFHGSWRTLLGLFGKMFKNAKSLIKITSQKESSDY